MSNKQADLRSAIGFLALAVQKSHGTFFSADFDGIHEENALHIKPSAFDDLFGDDYESESFSDRHPGVTVHYHNVEGLKVYCLVNI